MTEDEWELWEEEDMQEDWFSLLSSARTWFKFPRCSLDIVVDPVSGSQMFESDLNNDEIQILSTYMKCEWLNRIILSWENVKPLYAERDFSQANLLDKFTKLLKQEKLNVEKLESKYYRSINYKPFGYRRLATQIKDV